MATYEAGPREEREEQCFLCVLDPQHRCTLRQLEGRLIAAFERTIDGEKVPVVIIDIGTARVELRLTHYYRQFVKEVYERGIAAQHLLLRFYHLPTPPIVSEYKGQPRHIYNTNSYTLVVLEPDVLLNITDLNHAEYCTRQYLLHRLVPSSTNAATIRGNLVHHCFKELLKEHDRGELMQGHNSEIVEMPLATLQRHLEQALEQSSIELALANVTVEQMRLDVAPHLESLAMWYQKQSATLWDRQPSSNASASPSVAAAVSTQERDNYVRAETFLLAPEIGLRGRLDLLWKQSNRQRLLELKTGGGSNNLPKSNHRWQVYGYHALLAVRRDPRMEKALATLLYSGTPGEAQAYGIKPTVRELHRVNESRNILVLDHVLGTPSAPPGPSRCTKCMMRGECIQVSSLLGWQPPTPDRVEPSPEMDGPLTGNGITPPVQSNHVFNDEDAAFFARYYRLLQIEGRTGEQQLSLLWQTSVAERIERGAALGGLLPSGPPEPTGSGEWEQEFLCTNTSELREGDEVLLSDGNPIIGEVVTGTIKHIRAERVRIWSPELINHPTLIDRYETNIVHVRTVQNLLRWLQAPSHLRGLVAGRLRPRFTAQRVALRPDFNDRQNHAVERALQMQDYLLIQGPPGTGKTSVIAEIVKRLSQQGQRVLLAAFTNQAVDNMLKRLAVEGFQDYIRLGHDRSVHADVQEHLLKYLVQHGNEAAQQSLDQPAIVRAILHKAPVVASTTATWSSEKYIPQAADSSDLSLQFDVAIIDEASQLTIPAILGALRFVKRFILVGDEKQLPPLVLSKEAAEQGLATSLFSYLKALDAEQPKLHGEAESASVDLRVQYRMNKWISHFSSRVFYAGLLEAAPTVASRVLAFEQGNEASSRETASILAAIHPKYPLVFLDVRDGEGNGASKSSNAEARAVRALVQSLLARGIAEQAIGIIAPYRAQVANLRRHLFSDDTASGWQALSPETAMSIDTVDRFQGGERMVIIMSFATSETPSATSPLREFLTNPHRLNVALTRAQRKLIVVGCAPALEPLPYFDRLLTYCSSMKTLIAWSEG